MKKNILITTQVLDVQDPLLGFFIEWVRSFAHEYEQVTVICLKKGTYNLPDNVHVLSLGKEDGVGRWAYVGRFFKYIWQERKNYDVVFVHMNQIYVILGGLLWRVFGKKISLWYAHGHIPFSLRIAEKITNLCFASTTAGFKLQTKKLRIVGQGIDTQFFAPLPEVKSKSKAKSTKVPDVFTIITVGRISDVKRIKESIQIVEDLMWNNQTKDIQYHIIGVPGLGIQYAYYQECVDLVKEKNLGTHIHFLGGMSQAQMLPELQRADMFLNISQTGSLDKAILEAMSTEVLVISSNESFVSLLPKELKWLGIYSNLTNVSMTLQRALDMSQVEKKAATHVLREIVVHNHGLDGLVGKIKKNLDTV